MKPVRKSRREEVSQDPWQGAQSPQGQEDTAHVVDADGALNSHTVQRRAASHCGCLQSAAGYCAICQQTACAACFGRCAFCQMPLCPRHSAWAEGPQGERVRLCADCHEATRLRRAWARVGSVLSRLFLKNGGRQDG